MEMKELLDQIIEANYKADAFFFKKPIGHAERTCPRRGSASPRCVPRVTQIEGTGKLQILPVGL